MSRRDEGASGTRKRLVTERDVARLAAGAQFAVDRDTIVTPAARDLAFARGIVLVEAGAAAPTAACGCESCRAGKPCGCAGPWPKLADGDYVLEVRGGRVRARRVEP